MLGASMVVTTIPVRDLERSKAFYGETLGLTLLWDNPASARFRCGEVSELSIFKRPGTFTEHTLGHSRPHRDGVGLGRTQYSPGDGRSLALS